MFCRQFGILELFGDTISNSMARILSHTFSSPTFEIHEYKVLVLVDIHISFHDTVGRRSEGDTSIYFQVRRWQHFHKVVRRQELRRACL